MLLKNYQNDDDFMEYIHSSDALFHYTGKQTVIEKILLNKTLRFGHFSGTNDPQEYRQKLTGAIGWGWDKNSDQVGEAMHYLKVLFHRNSKFLSFCTNQFEDGVPLESGLLKSRMWAQYGDNHEGACLILSKEKLIASLEEQKQEHEVFLNSAITYIDPGNESEPILKVNQSDFADKSSDEIAVNFFLKNSDKYLFRKQQDYRDECEHRIVNVNKDVCAAANGDVFVSIKEALKGVVFGDRFPEVYAPTISELLKELHIVPKRLAWHKNGYYLNELYSTTNL